MPPAARATDVTAHGGIVTGGDPTVLIGGLPAARLVDPHMCLATEAGTPHVGGVITRASTSVLIGGQWAARMLDSCDCLSAGIAGGGAPSAGPAGPGPPITAPTGSRSRRRTAGARGAPGRRPSIGTATAPSTGSGAMPTSAGAPAKRPETGAESEGRSRPATRKERRTRTADTRLPGAGRRLRRGLVGGRGRVQPRQRERPVVLFRRHRPPGASPGAGRASGRRQRAGDRIGVRDPAVDRRLQHRRDDRGRPRFREARGDDRLGGRPGRRRRAGRVPA